MRILSRLLLPAIILLTAAIPLSADDIFTVVIDAGHGGKDPGAVNGRNQEKTINLNVALRVGELISKNCKDVKVIYTRKTDVFVELNRRAEIANKANADLFISIHTNSAKNKSAYGAETYLLGVEENRTSANLSVARQENDVIVYESDYQTQYAGYDPNSTESQIIFEFMQNEHQKESLEMASLVQEQLTGYAGRHDRGVHQAGFLVLWKNAMPSILIELGYISNQTDMNYLIGSAGVETLSKGIYRAFDTYLKNFRSQTAANSDNVVSSSARTGSSESDQASAAEEKPSDSEPIFKIQFLTSKEKLKAGNSKLKGIRDFETVHEGGVYKYMTGATNDYEKAKSTLSEVKKSFKDAFMTAFVNGQKTDVRKAAEAARKNNAK